MSSTPTRLLDLAIVVGAVVAGTLLLGACREDPGRGLEDAGSRPDLAPTGEAEQGPPVPVHAASLASRPAPHAAPRDPFGTADQQPREVAGRVVDHLGSAFGEARVSLRHAGKERTLAATLADDRGRFGFEDAPAGDLVLVAEHPGAFPAPPRAVGPKETIVVMIRGLALTGRVEDAITGLPIRAFEARARPGPLDDLPVPLPASAALARTQAFGGEQGQFEFAAPFVPAGRSVHLEIAARGYVPCEEIVESIGPVPLIVTLKPAARIKGRVVWSDDGSPALGTEVRIANRVEEHGALTSLVADVEEDGTFDLPAPGHETVLVTLAHPHAARQEPRSLNPVPGQEVDLGTLRLPASGTVEVQIQGEGAVAQAGIRVELLLDRPVVPATQLTDGRGTAVWSGIATGSGLLVFHLPGLARPLEHPVTVRRGQVTSLLVPPEAWLCRVQGTVSMEPGTAAALEIAIERRLGEDLWDTVRRVNLGTTREFAASGLRPGVYRLVGLVVDGERRFRAASVVSLEPGTTWIDLTLVLVR